MEVVFILYLPDHALIPDIILQVNIPTAYGVIEPSFFQNYWWLRSPYTNYLSNDNVYYVYLSGGLDLNSVDYDSYGRSPSTPLGSNTVFFIGSNGLSTISGQDADYSYGHTFIRSPGTKHDDLDACCVALNGEVFDTVNIGVSYGRKDRRTRSMITMRGRFFRMVTSTTTSATTMSRVPTGVLW